MRKLNSELDEPRTGWDAFGIQLANQEGVELFVDGDEIWTQDKKAYVGKLRKDGQNYENNKSNRG